MHIPLDVSQKCPTSYASEIRNKRPLLLHSNVLQGFIIVTLSLARDEKAAFRDELSVTLNASLRRLKIMSVDKT